MYALTTTLNFSIMQPPTTVNTSQSGCSCTKIQSYKCLIIDNGTNIFEQEIVYNGELSTRMTVNLSDYNFQGENIQIKLLANTRCGTSQGM